VVDRFASLRNVDRLYMEVPLEPAQGSRFQPTGFPDLGAAQYEAPRMGGSVPMLLVESAQSVANRLETVCWDESAEDLVAPLKGMPYVRVESPQRESFTNSILEAHRLNSPYILGSGDNSFLKTLQDALGTETDDVGLANIAKLANIAFHYDPNSVLHGLFLAKKEIAGGRYRMKRLLSGFIEARNVSGVDSGGVKNDRVDPRGDTKLGFGNVPYHRTEYTAEAITAYFNLDLVQLRAYRIRRERNADVGTSAAEAFLTTLALWKIRRFLASGLRLRTACDFRTAGELKGDPSSVEIPDEASLAAALPDLVARCASEGLFASPAVTTVLFDVRGLKPKGKR